MITRTFGMMVTSGEERDQGSIKNRNVMDLTEAEDIKKGGKNTQKTLQKRSS